MFVSCGTRHLVRTLVSVLQHGCGVLPQTEGALAHQGGLAQAHGQQTARSVFQIGLGGRRITPESHGLGRHDAGTGQHGKRPLSRCGSAQGLRGRGLPGLFVPMAPGRLHLEHTGPALTGTVTVGLNPRTVQKLERQIQVGESTNQALVGGTGTQAEPPTMPTAHDLDLGQSGDGFVRRSPRHQTQPAPALVLAHEICQHHHHHAGQRLLKSGEGVHSSVSGKLYKRSITWQPLWRHPRPVSATPDSLWPFERRSAACTPLGGKWRN